MSWPVDGAAKPADNLVWDVWKAPRAVIFDLDGVIVNTAEHHYLAWSKVAEEMGIPFPRETRKDQIRGVSRRRSLDIMLDGREVAEDEAERLMARKDGYYRELIQEIRPHDMLPGVPELISDLRRNDVKVAVGTVSKNARAVLSRLGIAAEFDAVVDGHVSARSKPAPDLFLHAAAGLGIPPWECVVIEDAPAGIEAAEAAGMQSVALGPEERFREVKPDVVIPSLNGVKYEGILHLLREAHGRSSTWCLRETGFDPALQGRNETNFTVGNGYLGTRGCLEEGYPGELRSTLIHRLYDDVPLFHTELVNVPDWTSFHLRLEGESFSLLRGEVLSHERVLDFREGSLRRRVRWRSPRGHTIEIHTLRFASLADPHLCVQLYGISSLDFEGHVEIAAFLDANAANPGIRPVPEIGLLHWEFLSQGFPDPQRVCLKLRTRRSRTELGLAVGVLALGTAKGDFHPLEGLGCPGMVLKSHIRPGETAVVVKVAAICTSHDTEEPLRTALERLGELSSERYAALLREHRAAWKELWEDCDVLIEGDDIAQQAVRFDLYHLLIAAPRNTDRASIPGRTLSGFGYRGHVFWDTDIFILPFFTFTRPETARRLLLYRYHTLAGAREKARQVGYEGAMYAWESAADGQETTPKWVPSQEREPIRILCGDLEQHISSDVAYAVWQYWEATGDEDFLVDYGAEIILDTAVFWGSRVEYDADRGRYEIRDVIGPDEYHQPVCNNAFTNRLVQWHLDAALEVYGWLLKHHPDKAKELAGRLDLTDARLARWADICRRMYVPQVPASGLIEQFDGFLQLEDVDLRTLEDRTRSVWALLGPERVQQIQVLKQPDVLMLLYLLRDRYDKHAKRVNWDYYEPRTDHSYGSSLGPAVHAALGCELGEGKAAYEHFMRAALVDLADLRGNTRDGIHAASAGGVWQALVFGFAGLIFGENRLEANPRLPRSWSRLRFMARRHGQRFVFDLQPESGASRSSQVRHS